MDKLRKPTIIIYLLELFYCFLRDSLSTRVVFFTLGLIRPGPERVGLGPPLSSLGFLSLVQVPAQVRPGGSSGRFSRALGPVTGPALLPVRPVFNFIH